MDLPSRRGISAGHTRWRIGRPLHPVGQLESARLAPFLAVTSICPR